MKQNGLMPKLRSQNKQFCQLMNTGAAHSIQFNSINYATALQGRWVSGPLIFHLKSMNPCLESRFLHTENPLVVYEELLLYRYTLFTGAVQGVSFNK